MDDYPAIIGNTFSGTMCFKMFAKSVTPTRVIYNDPATIVEWSDGTKTVVRCHCGDSYDEREGFLLCCAKKLMGNTGRYNDMMAGLGVPARHWTDERLDKIATAVLFS